MGSDPGRRETNEMIRNAGLLDRPPIDPAGWREWHPGDTGWLKTAFYAEFHSTGPGGSAAAREPFSKQLTEQEAEKFSTRNVLGGADGWNPTAMR